MGESAETSGPEKILLLGDPGLRRMCSPVSDIGSAEFRQQARRLTRALEEFRSRHGFGRAISAPQIGIQRRMIAMNLGEGPFLIVNPMILWLSGKRFTMWDDCMSFPWLMVRVERHLHLDLEYLDEKGVRRAWRKADQAVSELVQHEVDHLNGILSFDRAVGREPVIARQLYEERKDSFDAQVDYAIGKSGAAWETSERENQG